MCGCPEPPGKEGCLECVEDAPLLHVYGNKLISSKGLFWVSRSVCDWCCQCNLEQVQVVTLDIIPTVSFTLLIFLNFAWVFQWFSNLMKFIISHKFIRSQNFTRNIQHQTIALGDSKVMTEMWSLLGRPEVPIQKRRDAYPMGMAAEMHQINKQWSMMTSLSCIFMYLLGELER